jgi:signal transduction histidine kinase
VSYAETRKPLIQSPRSIQIGVIPLYLACAAVILRGLTYSYASFPSLFPWYAGLELAFLLQFILVTFRPSLSIGILQTIFVVQSIIILCLISLPPHLDFITALFTLLCYQMALVIPGKRRWVWCGLFCALILFSLIAWKGVVLGIALSLIEIAGCIVILTYVIAFQEEERSKLQSEAILRELQEKNSQLQVYSTQVEQIAAIEERNRLARELHDSVSQTIFSIVLNTRSTQILIERQPERVRSQLIQLQMLAQEALAEMRSLLAQLRPQKE